MSGEPRREADQMEVDVCAQVNRLVNCDAGTIGDDTPQRVILRPEAARRYVHRSRYTEKD